MLGTVYHTLALSLVWFYEVKASVVVDHLPIILLYCKWRVEKRHRETLFVCEQSVENAVSQRSRSPLRHHPCCRADPCTLLVSDRLMIWGMIRSLREPHRVTNEGVLLPRLDVDGAVSRNIARELPSHKPPSELRARSGYV
nr:hypothetical protein CFP56_78856 [Quercus suber]